MGKPHLIELRETCGSAHYWAREMAKLGHEVKLIAAQYIKPFVLNAKKMTRPTQRRLWKRHND